MMDSIFLPVSELSSYALLAFPGLVELDKKALRREIRRRRKTQDCRAARYKNGQIAQALFTLPEIDQAGTVAAYAPTAEEAGNDGLLSTLLEWGKRLALPRIVEGRMTFAGVRDLERDLNRQGSFGIREPDPDACAPVELEEIDLFLVPGVGFDCFGSRAGYGGGYYDRILSCKRPGAVAVALAYQFQVRHAIPTEPHDRAVDAIVTEKNVYRPFLSTIRCPKEGDTRALASTLLERGLEAGTVMALHGDLGTGKTVFVKGLAEALHTKEQAVSPTFVYCRHYHGVIDLYHLDAYRLQDVSGEDESFWDEILRERGMICVEWAERLGTLLPKETVHLFGRKLDNGDREWTLFTPLASQRRLHGEANAAAGD